MDAQNSSPHQEKKESSSPPFPSQQKADTRHTLTTEPFQPVLNVLADLERDDPEFAFPAARLVGLYRRLCESCVSKHIDGQKLEQSNRVLKEADTPEKREGRSSALP
ncbi:hypothetical protein MYU51_019467 [Penicillium brevicompactum]